MAATIWREVNGIKEVYIKILSQIGKPIDQPLITDVQLILEKGIAFNNVNTEIENIINKQLSEIRQVTLDILQGKVMLF